MFSSLIDFISNIFGKQHTFPVLLTIALVLAAYSIEEQLKEVHHYKYLASETSFNIVEQALKGKTSEEVILETVRMWQRDKWTAQTGSLKTLCLLAPTRLEEVMLSTTVHKVCILVR
ncbi:hypothetical protein [Vibrio mediterranei]|uniref:hypothetical protein n=1 Tax=Vibrio mediterranei TaxID=689 RepID=UPI001EFE32B0|nr:hypothetical protein [Vibrio mediterranei]MCG9659728.1 hypothetical protein [Vibrio mediterranei]